MLKSLRYVFAGRISCLSTYCKISLRFVEKDYTCNILLLWCLLATLGRRPRKNVEISSEKHNPLTLGIFPDDNTFPILSLRLVFAFSIPGVAANAAAASVVLLMLQKCVLIALLLLVLRES